MCLCLGSVKGESRECPPLNVVRSRRSNIRQLFGVSSLCVCVSLQCGPLSPSRLHSPVAAQTEASLAITHRSM